MTLMTAESAGTRRASDVRSLAQWPDEPPDVAPFMHGWFFGWDVFAPLVGPHVKLIVELGSWLGLSARWFCQHCPNAVVVCIDHWEGSPEMQAQWSRIIPQSHAIFLRNLWEFRDRVVPLRMSSTEGVELLESHGARPDFVYIDADHSYESVLSDVRNCRRAFPDAVLVGDDWNWGNVDAAVRDGLNGPYQHDGRFWWTE